jgi:hypothetical protein
MRRCLILAAAALALAIAPAGASPTGFADTAGDSGTAPDFSAGVLVANDNRSITIAMPVANRGGFTVHDNYAALLDTGTARYEIDFNGSGAELDRWTGTAFEPTSAQRVAIIWLVNFGPAINVLLADIGNPSSLTFVLSSTTGAATDRAPDDGSWAYALSPLSLTLDSFTVGAARGGHTLKVSALVTRHDWEVALSDGTIVCSSNMGKGRGTFGGAGAICTWRLPRSAAGKRLVGTIAVRYQGVRVGRSFSVTIR